MRFFRKRNRHSFENNSFFARFISNPIHRLTAWIGSFFRRDHDPIDRRNFFGDVFGIFSRLLNYLIVAPITFLLTCWASSRRALSFLLGLPAIFAALIFVVPSLGFTYLKSQVRDRYDRLAAKAMQDEKHETAELFSRKLFALAPENVDFRVRLAIAIGDVKKDPEYALDLLEQVAQKATSQSLNAHLWIVQHVIGKNSEINSEDLARAERHLDLALQTKPEHFATNRLAYEMYMKANRPENALKHIRVVVKADPMASHLLLKLQNDLGMKAEMESTLSNVLLQISEVANRNPNEIRLWGSLVACCIQGERFEDAIQYIQQGKTLADPSVRVYLDRMESEVMVAWFDQIFDLADKIKLQRAILALNWAMSANPANGEAIKRSSQLFLDPNFDSKRLAWVVETLDADPNSYCSHLLIGWRALFIDKETGVATARNHWTIATTSSPRASAVLANLAVGIAELETDKIPFALQVVELALSVEPSNALLGFSRGLILIKRESWFEAMQQFEEVLPVVEDRPTILKKLIECSEKLQDAEKQFQYETELEQITSPIR